MADLLGEDPAAEFLQQENDELRELGIDQTQFGDDGAEVPTEGGDEGLGEFEADLGGGAAMPQEPVMNRFAEPAAPIQIQPQEEPESLKIWREEKAESLKKQVDNVILIFNSINMVLCNQK